MVESAVLLTIARFPLRTRFHHIVKRMEVKFFPSVTLIAGYSIRTCFIIICDEICCLPIRARNRLIGELTRFSTEILPVVSINAAAFVVLVLVERTHDGLVVEKEEIFIEIVVVDQWNVDFPFIVTERTKLAIFTAGQIIWVV